MSTIPQHTYSQTRTYHPSLHRHEWHTEEPHAHVVQFYEDDEFLLDALGTFASAGLSANDAVILVVTEAHQDGIERRIRATGLSLEAAYTNGQLVLLDASETLAAFMAGDSPDPERFAATIGGLITRAAVGRDHVRIYGEMVAVLWAAERQQAALELEELWNGLHGTHTFVLFCGYPMAGFRGAGAASALGDVCARHSRIIPAESYSAVDSDGERLRTIVHLQYQALLLRTEIAERTAAEAKLRALTEELEVLLGREQLARTEMEEANRLKDVFLASVSHELGTPLTTIIGWSQRLRMREHDQATITRGLKIIEQHAIAQSRLIKDMLDVSAIATGKLHLHMEPVDLAQVISAAVETVQLSIETGRLSIDVSIDDAARPISGDFSRLQQVLWNLLTNAVKFTPPGGTIAVALTSGGGEARITVADTGRGIAPEFLPFVFERFRQYDEGNAGQGRGLGLGLAIVQHLVERHCGTIAATSPGLGCGATFTIRLPLMAGQC